MNLSPGLFFIIICFSITNLLTCLRPSTKLGIQMSFSPFYLYLFCVSSCNSQPSLFYITLLPSFKMCYLLPSCFLNLLFCPFKYYIFVCQFNCFLSFFILLHFNCLSLSLFDLYFSPYSPQIFPFVDVR